MRGYIKLCALLAALMLLLCGTAHAEDDPIIVRVEDKEYPLSTALLLWEDMKAGLKEQGITELNENEANEYRDEIIESLVVTGVIECKLRELEMDQPTADDLKEIEQQAAALYNDVRQAYAQQLMAEYPKITEEEAREYALTFMALDEITLDVCRNQATDMWRVQQIESYVGKDMAEPTEEELRSWYLTGMVYPLRNAYERDIPAYERDGLYQGAEMFYIPLGYRYIRHILLPAAGELSARITKLGLEQEDLQAAVTKAQNALDGYHYLNMDDTEAQKALEQAQAALEDNKSAIQALYVEIAQAAQEQTDDISRRLAEGETFDSLLNEYGPDPSMPEEGYLVHADSIMWDTAFRDAAMALSKPGEVSMPVVTPAGVHFLEYHADAVAGEQPLTGETLENVRALMEAERLSNLLRVYIQEWEKGYEIVTSPELLKLPTTLD